MSNFTNFFKAALVGTYSNTATTFTVDDASALTVPCRIVVFNEDNGNPLLAYENAEAEICGVTAKAGNDLTVTRGQEGTTPITIGAGNWAIIQTVTSGGLDARYYTETETDNLLDDKANLSGGNTFSGDQTIDGDIDRTVSSVRRYTDLYLGTKGGDPQGIYILVGNIATNQKMSGQVIGIDAFGEGSRGNFLISFQSTIEGTYKVINARVETDRTAITNIDLVQVDVGGITYGAIKFVNGGANWYPRHFFFSGAAVGATDPILASASEVSNEAPWSNSSQNGQTVYLGSVNLFKESVTFEGTVSGLSSDDVGLGNVLNVAQYSKTETDNLFKELWTSKSANFTVSTSEELNYVNTAATGITATLITGLDQIYVFRQGGAGTITLDDNAGAVTLLGDTATENQHDRIVLQPTETANTYYCKLVPAS